ncbi:MAG: flagellar biosynthesis protein FlhB [Clostridiales bacterium]|nr:flagellar biosynthesis protein FlhB [Clostridiales bacterium]
MADSSKTEKATPKKRKDEREKGNIFQSKDFTSSLGILCIFFSLKLIGPHIFDYLKEMVTSYLLVTAQLQELNVKTTNSLVSAMVIKILLLSLPLLIIAALTGLLLNGSQTRFNISFKQIKFKASRLNPISGMQKMISMRSIVELIKSLIKVAIIAAILYTEIKSRTGQALRLIDLSMTESLIWISSTVFSIVIKIGIIMAGFGVLDYFYQWWDYEKQIRMTKQEIKDEYKMTEGDPEIKGFIKRQQRRMATMRMMQKVPTADVVIKNPTHYAVAIKYESKSNRAPVVIAKGIDFLALKIIEIAESNNVSVTENRPLARGLYESVKVGREIPEEYYQAVAEVLAFVYNLKRRNKIQ